MVHVVMILDESGSMSGIRDDVIKSVNEFIDVQQKETSTNLLFTFVKFNDLVQTVLSKELIQNVPHITSEKYNPTGCTALFKAISDTIDVFENESDVIMVIVTDGQENASPKEYTREKIFNLISNHKNKNGWKFIYLSSDIDTFAQGVNLGFGSNNDFHHNTTGSCNVAIGYSGLGSAISNVCNVVVGAHSSSTQ